MPNFLVKVAVKYEAEYLVDAEDKDAAEEQAIGDAEYYTPNGARLWEGTPYVIETRQK